jgi:hypothetical protein
MRAGVRADGLEEIVAWAQTKNMNAHVLGFECFVARGHLLIPIGRLRCGFFGRLGSRLLRANAEAQRQDGHVYYDQFCFFGGQIHFFLRGYCPNARAEYQWALGDA